jgi:hypothetical protein
MGMSALQSATFTVSMQWNATQSVTGSAPVTDADVIKKLISFSLGTNVVNGINEVVFSLQSIAGGTSVTLDLTSLTDVVRNAAVSLARIKGFAIWLVGSGEVVGSDTNNQVTGTAATSITVGNAAATSFQGPLSAAATYTITNGEVWAHGSPNAAGFTVDGTHKSLKILNNDGAVTAKVILVIFGADA